MMSFLILVMTSSITCYLILDLAYGFQTLLIYLILVKYYLQLAMMIFLILQTIQMLSHSTVFLHTQTILILKESEIWNALGAKKSLNKKNTTSKGLILLNLPDIFSSLIWIFCPEFFLFLKTCQFLSTGCWIWLPPFSESTFLLIVTCHFLKDLFKSKFYPKGFSPKKNLYWNFIQPTCHCRRPSPSLFPNNLNRHCQMSSPSSSDQGKKS